MDLGEDEAVEDKRTMKEVMRDKRLKEEKEKLMNDLQET